MTSEVRQALDLVGLRLCAAESIANALVEALGDAPEPAWVSMYRDQVFGLREATEALETALQPLWGVGGVAPDGDAASASSRGPSAQHCACPGAASSVPCPTCLSAASD